MILKVLLKFTFETVKYREGTNMMKKTKIICTMGPNTDNKDLLRKLMENGMDIARLNFSHGDYEEQGRRIKLIKELREELGKPIAILLDTKGPEIRVRDMKDGKALIEEGKKVTLTTREVTGDETLIPITYEQLPEDVRKGNRILIDDGLMELMVLNVQETEIECMVVSGGYVASKKGINVPNVRVNLPAITEKDKEDIRFGIENGIDFIAASFVRNADAIREIREIVNECNANVSIIAKIENEEGVCNVDSIIEAADGIMVARGDLGVEIPPEEVPFIQKRIINKCNHAFKPVITATQMLDSMMRNPRPTRAEVTDIANAIYDGTDAIMLSGETAVGKHPIEALKMMVGVAKATEMHLDYGLLLKEGQENKHKGISNAVSFSAVTTADNVNAKLILTSTYSGGTARLISMYRPEAQIVGLSPNENILRKMQILWGVHPLYVKEADSTDEILQNAVDVVKENNMVSAKDIVVVTGGGPASKNTAGVTNMIKVVEVI